jgi:hypothetical protein
VSSSMVFELCYVLSGCIEREAIWVVWRTWLDGRMRRKAHSGDDAELIE